MWDAARFSTEAANTHPFVSQFPSLVVAPAAIFSMLACTQFQVTVTNFHLELKAGENGAI
eukprot:559608-Pelagomonas_calceolata.AAC.1